MKVRITKQGMTCGKEGLATWDESAGKWAVAFTSPWVGWYAVTEFDVIAN